MTAARLFTTRLGAWIERLRIWSLLDVVGERTIAFAGGILSTAGFGAIVFSRMLRLGTWRRTVRAEFTRTFLLTAWYGLPAALIAASLVGGLLVYEAIFLLNLIGDFTNVRKILISILTDYVTPFFVAFLTIGRTGSVSAIEINAMRADGTLRLLRSQGIDIINIFVVPRATALALAVFCLSVLFASCALATGFLFAAIIGEAQWGFGSFLSDIVREFVPSDYVRIPIKTLLIGYVIGVMSCHAALESPDNQNSVSYYLPRAFVRSLLLILVTCALVDVAFLVDD